MNLDEAIEEVEDTIEVLGEGILSEKTIESLKFALDLMYHLRKSRREQYSKKEESV